MNRFFVDKITMLKQEPRNENDPLAELKTFLTTRKPPEDGFKFKEVDDEEILKLIKRLKGKFSG